jgi:hypothetical protein
VHRFVPALMNCPRPPPRGLPLTRLTHIPTELSRHVLKIYLLSHVLFGKPASIHRVKAHRGTPFRDTLQTPRAMLARPGARQKPRLCPPKIEADPALKTIQARRPPRQGCGPSRPPRGLAKQSGQTNKEPSRNHVMAITFTWR